MDSKKLNRKAELEALNNQNYEKVAKKYGAFSGLKKLMFGDEAETEKPSGVLENLDAYTGAPARAGISKLQDDFTDVSGALKAAASQFGEKPTKAPKGSELAAKMGLQGAAKEAMGMGLEMSADPSGPFLGLFKAASAIPFGLKALKGLDTAADAAKVANTVENMADVAKTAQNTEEVLKAAQGLRAADTLSSLTTQAEKGQSAAQQVLAARELKAANVMQKQLDDFLEADKQKKIAALYDEFMQQTGGAFDKEFAESMAKARVGAQAKPSVVEKISSVMDETPGETLQQALELAKKKVTRGPYGDIVRVPEKFKNVKNLIKK